MEVTNMKGFEQIDTTKPTKVKKTGVLDYIKRTVKVTVIGLAILGIVLVVTISKNFDTYLFATLYPQEMRNAILVHNKGQEAGQKFIDEVYSNVIK
jgi:hypothetical protein